MLLIAALSADARADFYGYYNGYYNGGYNRGSSNEARPIISLELDPQKSMNSAFRIAAREGRTEDAKRFLESGAQVNAASESGMTALMYAARGCYADGVKMLLERGASPNLVDEHGRTALMFAVSDSCEDAVRLLLATPGVALGIRQETGKDALDLAHDAAAEDIDGAPAVIERCLINASRRSSEHGHGWANEGTNSNLRNSR